MTHFTAPLMVMGCTSDAGKSYLVALLCRRFKQRGLHCAPFKAQNMSNNAAVCREGGEIGRAQALQAQAAGVNAHSDMNPVLIKPQSDSVAQVLVHGKVARELHAIAWHERKAYLWPAVVKSLSRLQTAYPYLVIEGAGSPAEVNLRRSDIVNMEVALHTQAQVYLVADIDRGGAYAHLLGTFMCLSKAEQARVKGFVLNKFRGEQALLDDANRWLEAQTGIPVVAVIPYLRHHLPEEDNFFHQGAWQANSLNIALIRYPYASNLDEFDPLFHQKGVNVVPVSEDEDLTKYQAIILPGSKHVAASLDYLREKKLDKAIAQAAQAGVRVLGICGGLQILGEHINDSMQLEGGSRKGLGLLPLSTDYRAEKCQRSRTLSWQGASLRVYEIHHGYSQASMPLAPFIEAGSGWQQGNIQASYCHGLFENHAFTQSWLNELGWQGQALNWQAHIDDELDRLCAALRHELDALIDGYLASVSNKA